MRTSTILILGVATLLAATFGLRILAKRSAEAPRDQPTQADGRAARTSAVSFVAPAPLPSGLPLAGPEGNAADGRPRQHVDRAALRSLLHHRRFADLTRYLEQLQAEFEADPAREAWPMDAADAFASAEPELLEPLGAWVEASPESFAPRLARAAHRNAVAWARRGGKWAKDTPGEDVSSAQDAATRALVDAERALALRPRLVAAHRLRLLTLRLGPAGKAQEEAVQQAIAGCPSCFQVRVAYLLGLAPRWGGSYAAMEAFAAASADPSNPRLRLLRGYVDWDRAQMLRYEKKFDEALAAIERATALGDHWEFLQERAAIAQAQGAPDRALPDFDRALALRPGHPQLLAARGWAHMNAKQWEQAGLDLLACLRVAPTEDVARRAHPTVVEGLVWGANKASREGRREEALRLIDLASELAPTDAKVRQHKTALIEGRTAASPSAGGDLEALERAVRERPDDLRAFQQLDYALARKQEFAKVVDLWSGYLARHPSDGQAYLERGGAYFHLRKLAESRADAAKACELGVSEGCAREKQLGKRPGR